MREILIADPKTGLPKRIDGTVPKWALDRKREMERICKERGWPSNPAELSLDQVLEIAKELEEQGFTGS
jgi:hypothetical protein